MSEERIVKGILIEDGEVAKYDYRSLANVPKVQNAEVGMFLRVKEVDELGNAKSVEAVSMSDSSNSTQNAGIHIGPKHPADTSRLWVDTSDDTEDEDPLEGYYTSTETDAAIKSYVDTALGVIENGTY